MLQITCKLNVNVFDWWHAVSRRYRQATSTVRYNRWHESRQKRIEGAKIKDGDDQLPD